MTIDRDVRDRVVADYLAGDSSATVAARYGISAPRVLTFVRDAGHEVRPPGRRAIGDDVRESVVADYLAGDTTRTLAARYGISNSTVVSYVEKSGRDLSQRRRRTDTAPERDAAIVRARRDGALLRDIGARFGVTGERARQVIAAADPALDAAAAAAAADQRDTGVLRRLLRQHPGRLTWPDLAAMSGVPQARARRLLNDADTRLIAHHTKKGWAQTWTDDAILAALRSAAAVLAPHPVTSARYDRARRDGRVDGPSTALITRRFGTWTAACDAAAVTHGTARPADRYSSAWTDDEILNHVADYLAVSDAGTVAGYTAWRAVHAPAAPSWPTVQIRFGSWSVVKPRALRRLVARGHLPGDSVPTRDPVLPKRMRDAVARAADRAGMPAVADPDGYDQVRRRSDPTGADVLARAGTWGTALTAAGLDPAAAARTAARLTDADADTMLRNWAAALPPGATATTARWDSDRPAGAPGSWAYTRRYGGWRTALTALGIPAARHGYHPSDPALMDVVVKEYLAGDSAATVAARHQIGATTVIRWVKAAGHPIQGPARVSQQDRDNAVREYLAGDTLKTVAARYGVTAQTVQVWIRAAGHRTRAVAADPRRDDVVRDYLAGDTLKTVGARYGISPTTVWTWVRAAGHSTRPRSSR